MKTFRLRLVQTQTLCDDVEVDVLGKDLADAKERLQACFDVWNSGEADEFYHPDDAMDRLHIDPQNIVDGESYIIQIDDKGREIPPPPPARPAVFLGRYRHWKGTMFDVLAVAQEAATGEWWIVHCNPITLEVLTIRYVEWAEVRADGTPRFVKVEA